MSLLALQYWDTVAGVHYVAQLSFRYPLFAYLPIPILHLVPIQPIVNGIYHVAYLHKRL